MDLDFSHLPPATHYPVGGPRIPLASAEFINLPPSDDWQMRQPQPWAPVTSVGPLCSHADENDERPHLFEAYFSDYTPDSKKHEWIKFGVLAVAVLAALAVLARMVGWI